jgi:hypothetical protein
MAVLERRREKMMKGKMLQRLIQKILLASVFLFSACDLNSLLNPDYDEPVNEFLKEYTETAGIMAMELDGSYPVNSEGITCLPCTGDRKIKFYLRNPQNYTLNVSMETEDSVNTDVTVKQDKNDKSLITLLYPKDYLLNKDKDMADKNISGVIKIVEPKSGRSFADYSVSLHANSLPPAIKNAVFQVDSADINNANYVICFYFPELSTIENEIHQDVNVLLVNGEKKYVSGTTIYSDEECTLPDLNFTTEKPAVLTSETSYSFDTVNIPSNYIPFYFNTKINPSTDEIRYSFILQDSEGLKGNEVSISNRARQLNPPMFNVKSSKNYDVEEDTGYFTLLITHDGLCTDDTASGTVTLNYTIIETNGSSVFEGGSSSELKGSSNGSASVSLPKGTYKITASVTKNYYITSDEISVKFVNINRSPVFYVAENGDDNKNTGAKFSPYRTVQKAIDVFTADNYENAECRIYIMTDLTPPDDFDFSINSNSFINIPDFINNVIIFGFDGTPTIDAERTSENEGRVLKTVCKGTVTLENIKLKGGYLTESVDSTGGGIYNESTLVINGGSIYGNTAVSGGGIYNNGFLTLCGVDVSCNKAQSGGGVYNESSSELIVKGKNTVYGNTLLNGTEQSNIYLPVTLKIKIDGDISGSKIGVNVPWKSEDSGAPVIGDPAAFTSGYGYGTTNTSLPGEIFKSENSYSITDENGEAAFAEGGAGIYTALDFVFDLGLDRAEEDGSYTFYAGHKKVFTVTPIVKIGTTEFIYNEALQTLPEVSTEETITWNAIISCGSVLTGDMGVTVTDNKITIPAALSYPETFILKVTAEYMGVAHSKEFEITGIEATDIADNIDAINDIIASSSANKIEVLVTGQLDISGSVFTDISSGKTLTLIRSDDIAPSTSMLNLADHTTLGNKDGGFIILDGDNIKASKPLVSTHSCTFYNVTIKNACNESGDGGGLVCGKSNYLKMKNCTFENCSAKNGGAIRIYDEAQKEGETPDGIVNCNFKNCRAKENGGAIYCYAPNANRTVKVTDCTFENCLAGNDGNILYARGYYYSYNIVITNWNYNNETLNKTAASTPVVINE